MLAIQAAEAQARAEAERRRWEEGARRRRDEEERARQAKMHRQAEEDLLAAIDASDRTRRVHEWLALVEREVHDLAETDRQHMVARLEKARGLVGGVEALDLLKQWKAPDERK